MAFVRVDQSRPATTDDGRPQSINDWLHSYLLELKNDGVDINAEIAPEYKMGWGCILGAAGFCIDNGYRYRVDGGRHPIIDRSLNGGRTQR